MERKREATPQSQTDLGTILGTIMSPFILKFLHGDRTQSEPCMAAGPLEIVEITTMCGMSEALD